MKPSRDELLDLYEVQFMSLRDIGRLYYVSRQTVWRWLREDGIPRRRIGLHQRIDRAVVWAMHGRGCSPAQIALALDCSDETVYAILREGAA